MHEELTAFLFATEPEINANSSGVTETKQPLYPDNTFSKRVNEEPRTEE